MLDLEEFSPLVGDIYDASLDPALWPTIFERICRFVHSSSAHLFAQENLMVGESIVCCTKKSRNGHRDFLMRRKYLRARNMRVRHYAC